ncbi:septation protein SepH [Glutamicibacter uratoxydans]|uniref:septation protein SepH n=1 Tax=Glutamicibacter uratoxydans TaxID=43667 RepID=UPI003D6F5A8F
MRQLRLVGIHENGSSLQVSSDDGMSFELPVDDALRSAMAEIARARAPRNREQSPDHSPREIQSRVRAGASAYDLSIEWDVPIEQILKYEGPVLAERAHIAQLAQRVEVSGPQTDAEYREAFGEEPADLGAMVNHRLGQLGIDAENVEWDSWKDPEGQWMVTATFASPLHNENVETLGKASNEDQNVAKWAFHPQRRTLRNLNRWSQTLSEQAAPEYFSSVTPVAVQAEPESGAGETASESGSNEELIDLLNARRGQRTGSDQGTDERLNEIIERNMNKFEQEDDESGLPHLPQTISTRTSQLTVLHNQSEPAEDEKSSGDEEANQRKSKRSSVPSWDDIMFGRRKKD